MYTEKLYEQLESLLERGSDSNTVVEGGKNKSPSAHQCIAYENERFLVAWVILTRFSQNELDRAWGQYGDSLSLYAMCLLSDNNADLDVAATRVDNSGVSRLLRISYIRLVAQVTGRLATPPSGDLRLQLYISWKHACLMLIIGNFGEKAVAESTNSIYISLNVDVYNAFIAWMEHDVDTFSSNIDLKDILNANVTSYTKTSPSAPIFERETDVKKLEKEKKKIEAQSKFKKDDRMAMLDLLDPLLGRTTETQKIGVSDACHDTYTIENMQKLMFLIFEIQVGCTSEEVVRHVLAWLSRNVHGEILTLELKVLWHGWLMKSFGECISNKENRSSLLGDPKMMDAMQKITLSHAVSPDGRALRPMAWQTINQIIKSDGWSWINNSSIDTPICTWCGLACGEWKIQLEEDGNLFSEGSDRLSIIESCGRLIISVIQYLVGFDESPDKVIPLEPESLLRIRQSLEETLLITSEYFIASSGINDDIDSSIVVNLWSQLFSEIDLSTSIEAENSIACLRKMLMVSSDYSLMQALVHLLATYYSEEKVPKVLVEEFDNTLLDPIMVYTERFWGTFANSDWDGHDSICWACIALDILVENQPKRIQHVANAILDTISCLVEVLRIAPSTRSDELKKNLRLVMASQSSILDLCGNIISTNKKSRIISSAVEILKTK